MWLVTRHGFFNIVESDDDREKGLLTVKGRKIEDLYNFAALLDDESVPEIQTSYVNDYHFRLKAPRAQVAEVIATMISDINYSKTKPSLHRDRSAIYFEVWETLAALQRES